MEAGRRVRHGGRLGRLRGIDADTPVAPFIPVMRFAMLFGLSMDYAVFLLGRVREEYLRHGDEARAVTEGLAETARVITAAAAIFVGATLVRMLLVPGLMQLLGRANWWIRDWLDRRPPRLAYPHRDAGAS